MPKIWTDQEVWDAFQSEGSAAGAARKLGGSRKPVERRLRRLRALRDSNAGPQGVEEKDNRIEELTEKVRLLGTELAQARKEDLTTRVVRQQIMGLAEKTPEPPKWLTRRGKMGKRPGVPTLFASDWHWGEVVNLGEVDGSNVFDLEVAHGRARRMVENAVSLLRDHVVTPDYPGIVFVLGGDMVTGDIHEELTQTNDLPILPTIVDIQDVLIWCISELANEFGAVFVPCVTGNHGRMSRKPRAKQRNATNFDWLIYTQLERWFRNDDRVQFHIPETADALYQIYGHRYKLTHGDQFRGGDGMIGPIGPITRGDHKKRSRDNQVGNGYDTLLMGHFHTLMQLRRFIVNGSLKGYDEYAYQNNFPFEDPQQALWLTHPEHGITISMPVFLGETEKDQSKSWVAWKAA